MLKSWHRKPLHGCLLYLTPVESKYAMTYQRLAVSWHFLPLQAELHFPQQLSETGALRVAGRESELASMPYLQPVVSKYQAKLPSLASPRCRSNFNLMFHRKEI